MKKKDYVAVEPQKLNLGEGVGDIPAIDEEKAKKLIDDRMDEAQKLVDNPDELESVLQRIEAKIADGVPIVGGVLAKIPLLVSLVRSWIKGEYKNFPIVMVVAVLLYFLSPIDLIPDFIPIIGYADDVIVIAVALEALNTDINEYAEWRKANGKALDF